MSKLYILLIVVLLWSCQPQKKQTTANENPKPNTENFDWLLGNWQRSNEKEGITTFENWTKKSNYEYLGMGFSLQNGDTVVQENIRLVLFENDWQLEVSFPNEPEATQFKMIRSTDQQFTCSNEENEFPTNIKYWKIGDKLFAEVWNDAMKIAFEFEKVF